ncbi:unnamed protein product [Leptosia nina]|uniref:Glucose-methanol-choline oxidoreductase N-terminal domain-containing protein n=1 Tax=Leptosia nina TaxID=320188 RepID=A0AAV1JEW4_9NEOP
MIWQPVDLSSVCPVQTNITACSSFGYAFLNLLVHLYGDSVDRVREDEEPELRNFEEFDFIVVGAGSAGCVVAKRLSENFKWRVLLLEAGGEEPDVTSIPGLSTSLLGSSIDWQFTTEPNGKSCFATKGRCTWPRGKVMGGSSAINSMSYIRGNKDDYDGWAALGNKGWSYEEVLPFFKKSEQNLNPLAVDPGYHGFTGEQSVARYPYIDVPSRILTAAFIERGLPLTDYNAGSINSPQVLMWSGIGPREHLVDVGIPVLQDLPVGNNLHDHVTFNGLIIGYTNSSSTVTNNEDILRYTKDFFVTDHRKNPLAGNGPVNSIAFLKSEAGLEAPDVEYQVDAIPSCKEFFSDPITYIQVSTLPTAFYDCVSLRTENLKPKSRGHIRLNPENVYGDPLINPNYFGDESDFLPLLRGIEFALTLDSTKAFKKLGAFFIKEPIPPCDDLVWGTTDYFICLMQTFTSSTYHPVGTCKMGPRSDRTAVVDPELKVYGVDRLRVIDASIMPVAPSGNTNAPSIMIGERAVDFIIREWTDSERY